ncbi:NEW3 domain-containing protein [Oceanobacillus senegalensis]|uniref:NEW3 domain-containing protein n=1 Tax=Oceanobacillus senegalensis TaxID=1936063 RepID=UPI000A309F57|nr:NEW3 domain-containing protein [Oceanobacillus senegalensis]
MKKAFYLFLSIVLIVTVLPMTGLAEEKEKHDVELWNVVKPLDTTVTFLNTGAHPDDERSDLLAYLSRGLGVKTASMIANRGEGGQNEIGTELGNALGIIRSNEMVEAAKITGVKAYHLSETTNDAIYDFGFSKSPEETLEKWGEEVAYERLIKFIRTYQPDIVMPSFRNVDSQHGHHRTMTILSQRAFEDAQDPTVFPEQLENGLDVWQIKKLYLPAESEETATTSIEIGDYDPIYGMSYPQLGEESRYMHKSQGMGNDIPVEPRQFHLELINSTTPENQTELFEGIPYDFYEWAEVVSNKGLQTKLEKLQQDLDAIIELYPNRQAILPKSQSALRQVQNISRHIKKANIDTATKNDLLHKLEIKEEQLQQVSFVSSSLEVETSLDTYVLTQGEETQVEVHLTNHGDKVLHHIDASLVTPENWEVNSNNAFKHLKPGESTSVTYTVTVPDDAEYFKAYAEPIIQVKISFKERGVKSTQIVELDNSIAVLPELSVTPDPVNLTVNTADVQDEIPVTVKVKNYFNGKKQASISLNLPEGWNSEPEQRDVVFSERFKEQEVSFILTPPSNIEEGEFEIAAIAESDGKQFDTTVQEISYDHINDSYFQYPSSIDGVAFELLKPDNLKVGYIESGFDKVADYLTNAGFDITKLDEEDLTSDDLSQYDTIITGIRANLSREDLVQNNERLLEYVENGGHLVVQYHKPWDNWDAENSAPYMLEIGQPSIEWRVTDEDAEVTVTQPDHRLFHYPNQITDSDWDNWVQERGLYFPMNWDENYETFVTMKDPGEEPFDGGILLTEYGEGTYIYTNLVFYRQIDNQVPGGYRIFTNLISYGSGE